MPSIKCGIYGAPFCHASPPSAPCKHLFPSASRLLILWPSCVEPRLRRRICLGPVRCRVFWFSSTASSSSSSSSPDFAFAAAQSASLTGLCITFPFWKNKNIKSFSLANNKLESSFDTQLRVQRGVHHIEVCQMEFSSLTIDVTVDRRRRR